MADMESVEMERRRRALAADVGNLVERYRAIFDWDVPDIDQARADRLILEEIRRILGGLERGFAARSEG